MSLVRGETSSSSLFGKAMRHAVASHPIPPKNSMNVGQCCTDSIAVNVLIRSKEQQRPHRQQTNTSPTRDLKFRAHKHPPNRLQTTITLISDHHTTPSTHLPNTSKPHSHPPPTTITPPSNNSNDPKATLRPRRTTPRNSPRPCTTPPLPRIIRTPLRPTPRQRTRLKSQARRATRPRAYRASRRHHR